MISSKVIKETALARSLIRGTLIILIDEGTLNLDESSTLRIASQLRDAIKNQLDGTLTSD